MQRNRGSNELPEPAPPRMARRAALPMGVEDVSPPQLVLPRSAISAQTRALCPFHKLEPETSSANRAAPRYGLHVRALGLLRLSAGVPAQDSSFQAAGGQVRVHAPRETSRRHR